MTSNFHFLCLFFMQCAISILAVTSVAYGQGPTRDHFPAATIESEVNTCTVIATTHGGSSSLETIVCDSTIPNYQKDCETYEGKCLPGTIDKIEEYLELRGLTKEK